MAVIISAFSITMAPHVSRRNSQQSILLCFRLLFWELFSNFSGSKGWNTLALISFLQLPSTILSPCISISVPNAKHVMKNNSYKNNSCYFIWTKIDFWIKNSNYTCHFLWRDDNLISKKYGIQKNFFICEAFFWVRFHNSSGQRKCSILSLKTPPSLMRPWHLTSTELY